MIALPPPPDPAALVKAFPNEYIAAGQQRSAVSGPARLEVRPEILWFARISTGWHPASQSLELRSVGGRPVRFSIEAGEGIELPVRHGTAASAGTSLPVTLRAGTADGQQVVIVVRNLDVPGDVHPVQVRLLPARPGANPAPPQPLRSIDAAGRLQRLVQPDGVILDYRYDGAGRLLAIAATDGYRVTFTYDSSGRRASMTDSQGTTVYRYDATGRLAELVPPGSPAPIGYYYDAMGHLTRLLYPAGRLIDYTWDSEGRLTAAGDTVYEYDAASGRLARETLANGLTAEYGYDAAGRIASLAYRDAGGELHLASRWELAADGLPLSITRETPDGAATTRYAWDAARRLAAATYPDGHTVDIAYDDLGRRTRVITTDASGVAAIDYTYDAGGRLAQAGDESFTYDARGNLVRRSSPRQIIDYGYDAENHLIRYRSGNRTLELIYDGDGRQVVRVEDGRSTRYVLDRSGAVLLESSSDGPSVAYLYGLEQLGAEHGSGEGLQRATNLYDIPFWNLAAVTDASGTVTESFPEAVLAELAAAPGRPAAALVLGGVQRDPLTGLLTLDGRAYDPVLGFFLNQPAPALAEPPAGPAAPTASARPADLTADLSGRLASQLGGGSGLEPGAGTGGAKGGESGLPEATSPGAGAMGTWPEATPVAGRDTPTRIVTLASNQLPDAAHQAHVPPATPRPFPRLTQLGRSGLLQAGRTSPHAGAATPAAAVTPHLHIHPEYLNFVRTQTGALPSSQTLEIGSTTSAAAGFTVTGGAPWLSVSPAGGAGGTPPAVLTVAVNSSGLTSASSPYTAQLVVTNVSDATDVRTVTVRVTVTDALAAPTLRSFDAAGRPERIVQPDGAITDFDYDAAGQLIGVRYPGGLAVAYTYDGNGNRAAMTDSRGTTIYQYDSQNRLIAVYNPGINPVRYAYDTAGHVTGITYPDGSVAAYTYDADGRMTGAQKGAATTTYTYDPSTRCVASRTLPNGVVTTYTCDADGRLTDVVHSDAAANPIESFHYTLDAAGRRTAMAHKTPSGTDTTAYTYDAVGRLVAVIYPGGRSVAYAYDAAGNRTSLTDSAQGNTAYQYDAANELVRAGSEVFQYDADGRLVRRASAQRTLTYTYNGQGLLAAVSDGTNLTTFEYDGDGIRTAKVANGQRTNYINSSGPLASVLMETDASWGLRASYTYGRERIAATEAASSSTSFFLEDGGGGSISRLVDSDATTLASYQYDAFGAVAQEVGALANPYTYDDEQNDAETGLVYLRGRYYDPTTGRFLTADPSADLRTDSLGQSPYAFVHNDPVNRVDPVGLADLLRATVSLLRGGADATVAVRIALYLALGGPLDPVADVGLAASFIATGLDAGIQRQNYLAALNGQPPPQTPGGGSGWGLLAYDALKPSLGSQRADQVGQAVTSVANWVTLYQFWKNPAAVNYFTKNFSWLNPSAIAKNFSTLYGAVSAAADEAPAVLGKAASIVDNVLSTPAHGDELPAAQSAPIDPNQLDPSELDPTNLGLGPVGDLGGVSLSTTATFLLQLQNVTGATYDEQTGQLVILGKQDVTLPQMNLDDLAVAVRSEYAGADPGVSIEPPIVNNQMNVRFVGQTPNTNFGAIMFEADRTLKSLMLGEDNLTQQQVNPNPPVPGYQSLLARRVALGCNGEPSFTRMWFQPQEVSLVLSGDGKSMAFSNVSMELLWESKVGDQDVADPAAAAFAAHFTQHYEDFAAAYPVLKELERLAKAVAVIKWIKDNNLPIDLSFINEHQIAYSSTPVSTQAITVHQDVGTSCTIAIQGGVTYEPPNQYQPDNPTSPVTDPLRQAALSSRPAETMFTWDFQAPSGPSAGSTTAVAQSFARFRRTGNARWREVDLSYPQPGPFPFELLRSYDSFSDQVGPFGPGWHVLPFELRFPVEPEVFTFGASNTALSLYGSLWLADRLAGREDEYVLLGIDNNNLPIYQRSGAADLLRQLADGTFLLVEVSGSQVAFNAAGALATLTDANHIQLSYSYDQAQRLIGITATGGRTIVLTYNAQGQVTRATGPDGRQVQYAYDAAGNLAAVTDPAAHTHTFSYDAGGHISAAHDALGSPVFAGTFDAYGRAPSRTLNTAATYRATFDLTNRTASTTDPFGHKSSRQFDDRYRPLQMTDPLGNVGSATYDGDFGPATLTDEKGGLTSLSYDAIGHLTAAVDPNGNQVQHFYDTHQRLALTIEPAGTATGFAYDGNNNLTAVQHNVQVVRDAGGNVTEYVPDPSNVETWTYDAAGNAIGATDPLRNQVQSTYNGSGQPMQTTLPSGFVVGRTYDANSRLAAVQAGSSRLTLGYDAASHVNSLTTATLAQTRYAWDANGRLTQATDATANSTTYGYDADGNLSTVQDAAGKVTTFSYDVQHHLQAVDPAAGAGKTYAYDELGRPVVTLGALGTATPVAGLLQGTLAFGTVPVGASSSLTFDVYSLGQAPVTISAITCPAPWSVTFTGPVTVTPGQALAVTVTFAPQEPGAVTASLTVTSNDPVQPQQAVALSGLGLLQVVNLRATSIASGIELDWAPFKPGALPFAHFNVYRSGNPIPGDVTGLTPLDQSLTSPAVVSFVDTTAVPGQPYYYAVTPQYASGFEEKRVVPVGPVTYFSPSTAFGAFGADLPAAVDTHALSAPDLAYNSSAGEYLAVYERDTHGDGSNIDVVGQRLSATGAPLGGVIPIAVSSASEQRPVVAYSPVTNKYLVVFEVATSPSTHAIEALVVSAAGAAVGSAFPLSADATDDRHPRLAYDTADDQFLAVFDSVVAGSTRRVIKARRVSSAGAVVGGELTIANIAVNSTPVDTRNPDVVYDSVAHLYLTACEIDTFGNGSEIDVAFVRVTASGPSSQFFIAQFGAAIANPSLAYDSTHGQFMLVLQAPGLASPTSWDVLAWKFVVDSSGATTGVVAGPLIDLSSPAYQEVNPRVAYSATTDENVVVWESGAAGSSVIEAARIQVTGPISNHSAAIEVVGGTDAEHLPAVAWKSAANEYLVAWQRSPASGHSDIHVRRIGYSTPLLTLAPASLAFGDTQVQLPVTVTNLGPGTLQWSATTSAPWLSVQPAQGPTSAASPLTVSVSRAGLAAGPYVGSVQVSSNGGTAAIAVTMTVDSSPPDPPNHPTPASGAVAQGGVTAAGVGLTLLWQDHDAAGYALAFDVYLSTDSSRVTALDPAVRIQQGIATATTAVTGLAFNTAYSWRVVAADGHGGVTAGPVWSFTTAGLAAPVLISVTPSPTRNTQPLLAWQPVVGAATYRVQVATDTSFASPLAAASGVTATSFTPASPLPQGVLYWRAQAADSGGRPGPFSAPGSFQILTTPPPVPQLIPVSPDPTKQASPSLAWGPVSGATSYRLQVGQSPSLAAPLLDVTISASSYVPPNPLPEGKNYWQVASIDAAGNQSAFSPPSTFTLVLTPPPPVAGLAATRTTAGVVITWTAPGVVPPYFSHYNVYRAATAFSNVAGMTALDSSIQNPLTVTYADLSATAGGVFYYAVTAVDTLGNENRAIAAVAAPAWVLPGLPQSPAPADGSGGQAVPAEALGWQASSADGGPLTYDVYLSSQAALVNSLDLSARVAKAVSTPATTASGLDYLTTYSWRVVAFNAHGGSTTGPVWSFTTLPVPAPAPVAYTPNPTNNSRPTLTWTAVPLASAYGIQIDSAGTFASPVIAVDGIVGTSFTPSSPLPEGTLYWRVRAFDSHGRSGAYSTASSFQLVLTPPPPVTGLAAARTAAGAVLTWTAPAVVPPYFSHYNIYRATASFGNVAGMAPLDSSLRNPLTATYTDPSVTAGVAYYYAVTAVDTLGNENRTVVAVAASAWAPPGVPQSPSPADGTTGQAVPAATLSWQASSPDGGARTYDVYLSSQAALVSSLDPLARVARALSTATATVSGLDYLMTYSWRVVAFNPSGGSTIGPVWSFTTLPVPAPAPVAYTPNPTNNSRPTLTWTAVPLASAYGIQIDSAGTFASPIVAVDAVAGTTFTPSSPLPEGTLYWRVRAFDAHARPGVFSTASSFQLILTSPPPVAGLTVTWASGTVLLGWSPVPPSVTAFDHYNVYRAKAPFSSIAGMTPLAGLTATSYIDGTASIGTTYEYAITAVDKAGNENPAVTSVPTPNAASFYTLTPCRVLDTRNPSGPYGGPPLVAQELRSFALAGNCGIPPTAKAVSLNVTTTGPTAGGDLRLFPGGITPPLTSTISFAPSQTRANNAVLGVAGDGKATLSVFNDMSSGTVNLILDVNGYFQ